MSRIHRAAACAAALLALSGCGGGGSSGSGPVDPPPPVVVDLQNAVEALFLASGPLSTPAGPGCTPGTWRAYPRGSTVRVRISATISGSQRAALESFVAQVSQLTAGALTVTVETTAEVDPRPGRLEVTATNLPDAQVDQVCRAGAGGCTFEQFQGPGVLSGARTVMRNQFGGSIHVHELGHGLLGFCHIDGTRVSDALMGNPQNGGVAQVSELERRALAAVYGSGLQPGAGRDDFLRAGLIHASSTAAAQEAAPGAAPDVHDLPPPPERPRRGREGAGERESPGAAHDRGHPRED